MLDRVIAGEGSGNTNLGALEGNQILKALGPEVEFRELQAGLPYTLKGKDQGAPTHDRLRRDAVGTFLGGFEVEPKHKGAAGVYENKRRAGSRKTAKL
jgi:hypothetical protein